MRIASLVRRVIKLMHIEVSKIEFITVLYPYQVPKFKIFNRSLDSNYLKVNDRDSIMSYKTIHFPYIKTTKIIKKADIRYIVLQ